jgi:hypothetical protein
MTMTHDSSSTSASAEKQALLAAFDTVLKTQAEEREASQREAEARRRARTTSRPLIALATGTLLVAGAYLAIVQPPWVFAPRAVPESLAVQEASLRISMGSVVEHIEHFRRKHGRLPESLEEAGAPPSSFRFERTGPAGYRLMGDNGPAHASYMSGETLAEFMGNSYQIVVRRAK